MQGIDEVTAKQITHEQNLVNFGSIYLSIYLSSLTHERDVDHTTSQMVKSKYVIL